MQYLPGFLRGWLTNRSERMHQLTLYTGYYHEIASLVNIMDDMQTQVSYKSLAETLDEVRAMRLCMHFAWARWKTIYWTMTNWEYAFFCREVRKALMIIEELQPKADKLVIKATWICNTACPR